MFGAILKATNSSFQKGIQYCRSIYVKKVMKLLAFIFEQPSYRPASKTSFGWRFSGGPIMVRLYVLTGCRSVLNPTCIYSSILAMFFSGVRFVSVNF